MTRSAGTVRLSVVLLAALLLSGCAARNIWEASRNGNYDQVRQMIENDPSLVNAVHTEEIRHDRNNRWTPLHYAAAHQQERVARLLLDNGADPLAKAISGWTALQEARQVNNAAIEQMILKKIEELGLEAP